MIAFIKKYYISLIIVALLFVAIVVFLIQSTKVVSMIRQKSEELNQIQLDYALAQEFVNNVHVFRHDNEYLQEFYEQIAFFLPNDDDKKIKLFSDLEQLAKDTGNESISISVVKIEKKEGVKINPLTDKYIGMKLVLVGDYNDLIYFLTKLENTKHFSDVMSLDIAKTTIRGNDNEETRDNLLQTTMNVVFYLEDNKK